jgi:mevalonate kinase
MIVTEITVPAKGMLFGEYGVLHGFPAITALFSPPHFHIQLSWQRSSQPTVRVKSDFFSSREIVFSPKDPLAPQEQEAVFFYQLLHPWRAELSRHSVDIEILHSFSPSLGFGSSSALIAGISTAFFGFYHPQKQDPLSSPLFWQKISESIQATQGKGSGYDVASQAFALVHKQKNALLSYEPAHANENHGVPQINVVPLSLQEIKKMGCFVKTGIYAETKAILQKQIDSQKKFAHQHGTLAQRFLTQPHPEYLKFLLNDAKEIALAQGLFPTTPEFQHLVQTLGSLPFKSMGAGHGDCLWVLASKQELQNRGLATHQIAFAFEDCEATYDTTHSQ